MPINDLVTVYFRDTEIGKIGYDPAGMRSTFQYSPDFLGSGIYLKLFPYLIKRTPAPQIFRASAADHFRGLPPAVADSLPDVFGNMIFRAWLDTNTRDMQDITVLEQLAYVGNRGMGALEYRPNKKIPKLSSIDIDDIVEVLKKVMDTKKNTKGEVLDTQSLLNIFKIGSSAGGARPKILISEHKKTGHIIPGDLETSEDYEHYLVKLSMDEEMGYNREAVEFSYYQAATALGIEMMPSKLIENRHFATLRFDRQEGEKKHVLTASGITGIDFALDPKNSTYENLFGLLLYLRLPPARLQQLYLRMVFNVVYSNYDDHLKNHSFLYDPLSDSWDLSPAYDLTYAINPMLRVTKKQRALSIGGKRSDIQLPDLLTLATGFTIKNPKGIIAKVVEASREWKHLASGLNVPEKIIHNIEKDFKRLDL